MIEIVKGQCIICSRLIIQQWELNSLTWCSSCVVCLLRAQFLQGDAQRWSRKTNQLLALLPLLLFNFSFPFSNTCSLMRLRKWFERSSLHLVFSEMSKEQIVDRVFLDESEICVMKRQDVLFYYNEIKHSIHSWKQSRVFNSSSW